MKKFTKLVAFFMAVCFILTACKSNSTPKFTQDDFKKIDGSTVTIPLSVALAQSLLGISAGDADKLIVHNKTDAAYKNLIAKKAEIIFVTYPSQTELDAAKSAGVQLEITPIVNDAFVFMVNKSNQVTGLTTQQIKDIYSGKSTNWSNVGGPDLAIKAYQRLANSGSQTGMIKFMGDTPLMKTAPSNYIDSMNGLVDVLASYDNSSSSIGYSYYYYVNTMYIKDSIKLLSVDGVLPSNLTIQNKTYPLVTPYYAVIRKDSSQLSFARQMLSFVLSNKGQTIAQNGGYVKVK